MSCSGENAANVGLGSKMFLCLVLVIICSGSVTASDSNVENGRDVGQRIVKRRSVRVCGIKLVNMMKKICNHCYRSRKVEPMQDVAKRNAMDMSLRSFLVMLQDERAGLDVLDDLMEKRWGRAGNGGVHRNGGGIANRCCVNQCSYSDLVSYCCNSANPARNN